MHLEYVYLNFFFQDYINWLIKPFLHEPELTRITIRTVFYDNHLWISRNRQKFLKIFYFSEIPSESWVFRISFGSTDRNHKSQCFEWDKSLFIYFLSQKSETFQSWLLAQLHNLRVHGFSLFSSPTLRVRCASSWSK